MLEDCAYCYGTGLDGMTTWGWGCEMCLSTGKVQKELNDIYRKYYAMHHKKDTGCDHWSMQQTLNELHDIGKSPKDFVEKK